MIQKIYRRCRNISIENNTKPVNKSVRIGIPFQNSEGKDRVLLCQRLQDSYSRPHCIVKLLIYTYIPFCDPTGFVLNPGLLTSKKEEHHCVKSAHIQTYSGPYFVEFRLNMERYGVSLRIQSECGKTRTKITPNTNIFHVVYISKNTSRVFEYVFLL